MWFLPRDAMLARYGPVSPSVCVHYKSDFYRNGWLNRAVLARELPSTHTYARRVSPKIKALPPGTLYQTLDLENFATAGRIVLSTKLGDGRACWSHLRFFSKSKNMTFYVFFELLHTILEHCNRPGKGNAYTQSDSPGGSTNSTAWRIWDSFKDSFWFYFSKLV